MATQSPCSIWLLRAEQRSDARKRDPYPGALFAGFMRNHLNGNGVEIIDIRQWAAAPVFI